MNPVNPNSFACIANLTIDAQQQLNDFSSCLSNVSLNNWIINASVNYDNLCLHNVSTNYLISKASLYNLSNLVKV